jgi:predicted lipoprotein with Yx(FWY)xxD motif
MRPLAASLLVALAVAVAAGASALAAQHVGPVVTWKTAKFGTILATKKHLALYTWRKEKAHHISCTGACAKQWPPLVVPHGTMIPKHVAGVMGTFSELMRPDGRTQVALDGHALYTFAGDSPTKILCNGVDGWYVAKVH